MSLGLSHIASRFGGLALSGCVGYLAFLAPPLLSLVLVVPLIAGAIKARFWVFFTFFFYYLGACVHIPGGIKGYFGESADRLFVYGAPIAFAFLASSVFLLVSSRGSVSWRATTFLLALVLGVIPPFGLIGVFHPIMASGLLFPGLGWLGLVCLGIGFSLLLVSLDQFHRLAWRIAASAVTVVATGANLSAGLWPPDGSAGWRAIATHDGRNVESGEGGALRLRERILEASDEGEFEFMVFPEATVMDFTLSSELILAEVHQTLQRSGRTVLFGAVDLDSRGGWTNSVFALGRTYGVINESRIPMPFGNWRLSGGVKVQPFGDDVVVVDSKNGPLVIAFSICYEDNLVWPHRGLLLGRADRLVSVANLWMTGGTHLESIQGTGAWALARMGGVPLTRSVNHPVSS